jgi:hypothetical protein
MRKRAGSVVKVSRGLFRDLIIRRAQRPLEKILVVTGNSPLSAR